MASIGAVLADASGLVVAVDSKESSARPMVAHLLAKWRLHSRCHSALCVVSFDCAPDGWLTSAATSSLLSGASESGAGIHKEAWIDCYTDPLGWDDGDVSTTTHHSHKNYYSAKRSPEAIVSAARQAKQEVDENGSWLVVIDSVSMILLRYGTARTFQLLGELRHLFGIENQGMDRSESSTSSANTMLTTIHMDMHDTRIVQCLEQMATTVLQFLPVSTGSRQRACQILNKRPSGRITLQTQLYTLGDKGEVELTKIKKSTLAKPKEPYASTNEIAPAPKAASDVVAPPIDPTAGLTFSLKRTEQQEQDRQALVLPYSREQPVPLSLPSLDEFVVDDEDEEEDDDPDGDLDI